VPADIYLPHPRAVRIQRLDYILQTSLDVQHLIRLGGAMIGLQVLFQILNGHVDAWATPCGAIHVDRDIFGRPGEIRLLAYDPPFRVVFLEAKICLLETIFGIVLR